MRWDKLGRVYRADGAFDWWHSHTMAPAPLWMGETIRVFVGAWDAAGISRIAWIDVDAKTPTRVVGLSERPALDLGRAGTFDDNGVFPGSVVLWQGTPRLYYTGFQLPEKVRYSNFGGAADWDPQTGLFRRLSEAPVLDRADEGLCVRAGLSVIPARDGGCLGWYSAGSTWEQVGGRDRPVYDVVQSRSPDGVTWPRAGRWILRHDPAVEHALGRPYALACEDGIRVFYTRRLRSMRYGLGCAVSSDGETWTRVDDAMGIDHGPEAWDDEMVYFPAPVRTDTDVFLFYSGNDFGRDGLGVCRLIAW